MANAVVLNLGCPLRSPGELKYPDVLQTDKSKPLGSGTEASVFFLHKRVEVDSLPPPKKGSQRTSHLEGKV